MQLPVGIITFVFTDVVGSTAIARRLGDTALREILAAYAEVITAVASANDGVIVSSEGDGFFVAFDDAANALRFGVRAEQSIAERAFPHDVAVRVRIGMHTGEALLEGQTYIGLAVHLAARIASAAHGGQVLASAETAAAARGGADDEIAVAELGSHLLKDFPDVVALVQVTRQGAALEMFPPLRTRAHVPTNLPATRDVVVGRADDVARVAKLLTANRLVTLTGVGGTGKTTLALETARASLDDYPDGVWLAELAPARDRSGVERALAAPLGVRGDAERTTAEVVLTTLRRRRALLVIDNAEHVLDDVAPLLDRILDACPYVSILGTSREPLGIRGEQVCRVAPLDAAAAAELFVARAQRQDDGFRRDASNASLIDDLCERLDGLPLAIELAAAATATLTVEQLAGALADRLGVLTTGPRSATDRQRTLRGAVAWSFDLLDESVLAVLVQLAVLRTPFDAVTAAGVAESPDGDLDAAIARLTRASLLEEDEDGRLRLLEVVRSAADELPRFEDVRARARTRHSRHFATLAPDAPDGDLGPAHDDFLAALDFAHDHDRDAERSLAVSLTPFWIRHGHVGLARDHIQRALGGGADARLLAAAASLDAFAGELEEAAKHAQQSLDLAGAVGDADACAQAQVTLAVVASSRGNYAATVAYATDAEANALAANAVGVRWHARRVRARAREFLGEVDAARAELLAVLDEVLKADDRQEVLATAVALGGHMSRRGDNASAVEHYELAERTAHDLGDELAAAEALSGLGVAHSYLGEAATARDALERAIAIAAAHGDQRNEATWTGNLGIVLQSQGDLDGAAERYQAALAMARDVGDRPNELIFLGQLGTVSYARGDYEVARDRLGRALRLARDLDMVNAIAVFTSNLANIDFVQGGWEAADTAYAASIEAWERLDNARSLAVNLGNRGYVAIALGRLDDAERFVQRSLEISQELGNRRGVGIQEANLGTIAWRRGDLTSARDHFASALAIATDLDDPLNQGVAHIGLGRVDLDAGHVDVAAANCLASMGLLEPGTLEFVRAADLAGRVLVARGRVADAAQLVSMVRAERLRLNAPPTPIEEGESEDLAAQTAGVATAELAVADAADFVRRALDA